MASDLWLVSLYTYRIADIPKQRGYVGSQSQWFPFGGLSCCSHLALWKVCSPQGSRETKKDRQGWGPNVSFDGLPRLYFLLLGHIF